MSDSPTVYQMKLELREIKPPIWRRILVKPEATLRQFHKAIQILFGWYECHLYDFVIQGQIHALYKFGVKE
jgi:hypothetical protein